MKKNDKDAINRIVRDVDLLKQQKYQGLIKKLMAQLDVGELRLVSLNKESLVVSEHIIDLMVLSVTLRRYQTDPIPMEKDYALIPGIRRLPYAMVRYGAFVQPGVVLMPFSLVNMGSRIGENTMIDGAARIGTGAYIGNNVHISGGVGIGGVLEPRQKRPVIINDGCFIGANSSISEGVIVGKRSIIGAGAIITSSTRIYDSRRGGSSEQVASGYIPDGVVVIPSSYQASSGLYRPCVEIIKNVESTRETVVNNGLR